VKVGVVTFPGSLDDRDAIVAVEQSGAQAVQLWHADATVGDVDAVILPGGFSYGDYLRCGAVAHRTAVMAAVAEFAREGGPVLGICNGFQVLCEAGLLPGALLRNAGLRFVCRSVSLTVENRDTPWTRGFADAGPIDVPVKNGEGRYYADTATLDRLEDEGRVVFRYAAGDNPNGSERDIAGICNAAGNVVGLMPHPEHAVDPVLWTGDGARPMFDGLVGALTDS
jgi:phosphoribosylformylglycinamidine synthase I